MESLRPPHPKGARLQWEIHSSTVKSLSCSRKGLKTIWPLWYGELSCWKLSLSSLKDGYSKRKHSVCCENIPTTILNCYKARSCSSCQILTLPSKSHSNKTWLIRPHNSFLIFHFPVLISLYMLWPLFPVLGSQELIPVWSSAEHQLKKKALLHTLFGFTSGHLTSCLPWITGSVWFFFSKLYSFLTTPV